MTTDNVVLYKPFELKKLNGTLFYSFEYFQFLKHLGLDVSLVLYCDPTDLTFYKEVFSNKYNVDDLSNIVTVDSTFKIMNLRCKNVLILDDQTYRFSRTSLIFADHVLTYSEFDHPFVGTNLKHKFYGYYSYQPHDTKYNIKLYRDIHQTTSLGLKNKTFLSTIRNTVLNNYIAKELGIPNNELFVKRGNKHNFQMWEEIKDIVYYHIEAIDPCNRILVESVIHNVPLTVHLNGHYDDSIAHRFDLINNGRTNELFLQNDDLLVGDFIRCCC